MLLTAPTVEFRSAAISGSIVVTTGEPNGPRKPPT